MYMKKIKIAALLLTSLLALTACEDDQVARYDFTATVEQMASENNNSKVYLLNEEWIYWEIGDMISIGCDQGIPETTDGSPKGSAYLTGASGDYENYNGSFATTLNWGAKYFLGLHPYDAANVITQQAAGNANFTTIKLRLKPVQTYRNDEKGDYTFDRQVLPMVAWYGGEWTSSPYTAFNLDFRSLAGLVRLQFYNKTTDAHINSIVVTEISDSPKQLCGMFDVKNYKTYDPHLESAANTAENQTVTLSMPGATTDAPASGILPFATNDLKSFYLVLPAVAGRETTTSYKLQVTVNTSEGSFTKNVTVPVRRNGITYLQAIGITEWDNSSSRTEIGLVGNGTQERPFKIYTLADLKYLRSCFNNPDGSGNVYINGQQVTADTWFRIMRSDITLPNGGEWSTGINNFKGHMTYFSNAAGTGSRVTHGITNRSCCPLFNSISADGHVKGLAIITNSQLNFNSSGSGNDYSPLCTTNNGTIEDCRNISPSSGVTDEDKRFDGKTGQRSCYAGICVENRGTIVGCDCAVIRILHNSSRFAGICYNNKGTIKACVLASPASISGATHAGGICYKNEGIVEDCYSDISYNNTANGSTNWGGIVYQNAPGSAHIVRNCYLSANAIIRTSGNVGAIVCENNANVDYCRNESSSLYGSNVGGIVATLAGGEVRNCYVDDSALFITLYPASGTHSAGGIVAEQTGGSISNCYSLVKHFVVSSTDATGVYGTLVGRITAPAATVNNCYALEVDAATPQFYGTKTNGTLTHCHLVGGTQTDVNSISPVNNTTLGTLLTDLNANKPANGNTWLRGASTDKSAPMLAAPAGTKQRRR